MCPPAERRSGPKGIHSKERGQKKGYSFSRGSLYKILRNPIYIGKINHKGTCHEGQHKAIIDQELWEQVQKQLASNSAAHKSKPNNTSSPLTNKLFDDKGERLVVVHANKKGRRYRYYISESLRRDPKNDSSTGWRLPGQEIEQTIKQAALEILQDNDAIATALQEAGIATQQIPSAIKEAKKIKQSTSDLIERFVQRVELREGGIRITLSLASLITQRSKRQSLDNCP